MDTRLLNQADQALSKCGRPVVPGRSVVPISKGFLVQGVVAVGGRSTFFKTITGDATWAMRSISIFAAAVPLAAPTLYVQVQLPNGRFLQNAFQDVTQIAGFGSWRYVFTRELECVPGSKIQVTLDSVIPAAALPQIAVLLFEGAYKYYLDNPNAPGPDKVGPRYLENGTQNILAPCWMSGQGPATPPGCEDKLHTYASDTFTATVGGAPLAGTVQIKIDDDSDFCCRRIISNVQAPPQLQTVVTAGTFLGMIRDGSGYALTSDYMDLRTYLQNAPFPHDWIVRAGDSVFVDLTYVDAAPGDAGPATCQILLEGVKRKRRLM